MNDNPQQGTEAIHQDMALSTIDLFARILAVPPAAAVGLDRLAVDNGRTRLSVAPFGQPQVAAQVIVDTLPDSFKTQASKIMIDSLPNRHIARKHSPGTSRAHQIEDGVDDFDPLVFPWSPSFVAVGSGKILSNAFPLFPSQVCGISALVSN